MSRREDYRAGVEAREELATHPEHPQPHDGAMTTYLAVVAYEQHHRHNADSPEPRSDSPENRKGD